MQEAYVPHMYLVNCIALHESLLSSMYRQPTQCLEDQRFDILSGTSLSFDRDRMIFNLFYSKRVSPLAFPSSSLFFHSLITHDLHLSVLTTSIPSNSIPLQYSYTGLWWRYSSLHSLGFDGNRVKYTYWDFMQIQLALIPRIWCKYS